jgi:spore coat protein U-like protein
VNFGTYTGTVVSPGSSPLSLNCPSGQGYQVLLNQGQSSGGSETVRQMTSGGTTLNYGLYQNASRTNNFGNSSGTGYYPGNGTGATQSIPIYPQLAAGQNVAPGTYTDIVTATLGGSSSGSTTFSVTATVASSCTISATALAFGTYVSTSDSTTTSTLSINCTNTTPYSISLDVGVSAGATPTTRGMTGAGGALLHYHIYQDPAHSVGWSVSPNALAGTGTGSTQTITAYGIVLSGQTVAPGSYADTITATITY